MRSRFSQSSRAQMSGRVDFFELMKSAVSKTRGKSVAQRLLAVAAAGHRMRLVLSAIWIAFFALLGQARAESGFVFQAGPPPKKECMSLFIRKEDRHSEDRILANSWFKDYIRRRE